MSSNTVNNNMSKSDICHKLVNAIGEVKEKLTDQEYKSLVEDIAILHTEVNKKCYEVRFCYCLPKMEDGTLEIKIHTADFITPLITEQDAERIQYTTNICEPTNTYTPFKVISDLIEAVIEGHIEEDVYPELGFYNINIIYCVPAKDK